jgi:hypothetical protein
MKPQPALDQLSRAELLHLVTDLARSITQTDIAFARWIVASNDWSRLSERAYPIRAARNAAWEEKIRRPNSVAARRKFDQAETALMSAELAASRAWTRRTRLYDEYSALKLAEEARAA